MTVREIKYADNPSQRQLCVLVIDASGSMSEIVPGVNKSRMQLLNEGLRVFHQDLLSDETASNRVRLAIVLVGGPQDDAALMLDWTDVADFQPFDFSPGGLTPLAQGLQIGLQIIEQEKQALRTSGIPYTRPWMFVLTDGGPTDSPAEWQNATAECIDAENKKRCTIFPIGVEGADMAVLTQISLKTPPVNMQAAKFKEFFLWLSSSSSAAAKSSPGDTIQMPAINAWANVQA
jgi:uncharacterized protein YegL